ASSRGDVYYPLAQAVAGLAHGLHGHIAYNAEQLFDDSCDDENLLRRAAELGVYRTQAYRAAGTATITGNDGETLLAETLLQTDSDVIYRTTQSATISGGSATIDIKAINAGEAGNLSAGETLRFIETQLGLDSEVSVIALTGGSDIESIDRVRERLSERRKSPAMGGSKADYVSWTLAAHSDVTRAWSYPNEAGLGTVTVRFVTEKLNTVVASNTHLTAVKNHIDSVRPASMKALYIYAVSPEPLNLEFTLLSPNTTAVRAAITAELKDLLNREATPGGTLAISKIREAISLATGEENFSITRNDDVTSQTGGFITLGEITWPAA
ncbi:hypothetical protein TW85_24745, partial [Marinomonas sp. S3726]|uniref:baseplate J/gp47 family protein n=1 Tax=Marinomonas sp. S3726 TaxID=579484 RepID=UPI0005F9FFB2